VAFCLLIVINPLPQCQLFNEHRLRQYFIGISPINIWFPLPHFVYITNRGIDQNGRGGDRPHKNSGTRVSFHLFTPKKTKCRDLHVKFRKNVPPRTPTLGRAHPLQSASSLQGHLPSALRRFVFAPHWLKPLITNETSDQVEESRRKWVWLPLTLCCCRCHHPAVSHCLPATRCWINAADFWRRSSYRLVNNCAHSNNFYYLSITVTVVCSCCVIRRRRLVWRDRIYVNIFMCIIFYFLFDHLYNFESAF